MRCLLLICALIAAPGLHAAGIDFNGDGKADILWRNAVTGENYIYPMDGTAVLPAEGFIRTVPDQNWQIAGIGDFDGDGKSDILWRNRATGENYIFPMDTLTIKGTEGYLFTVGSQNWQVAAVADFDGNGKADILWRNRATGENYVHLMNGLAVAGEGYLFTVPTEWFVAGTGDFNADGRADILWRNSRTGENYVYPMAAGGLTTMGTEGYLRTVPDQVWQVAGIGNFDGAAGDDILWRNRVTGENYIFFMNGATTITGDEGYLRTVTDHRWQIASIGDYNNDGRADILWRHGYTAEQYIYLMNGKSVIAGEGYTRTVVNAWRPAGPLGFQAGATPGCETISGVGVVPSIAAARTSGVAPLYVFFDATATTSNQTSHPFHEVEYRWNFGDTGSGAWQNGSRPGVSLRNEATGGVAGHVFEQPGTYHACVSVFDGVNTGSASVAITVTDPETLFAANTRCVSNDANFDGCPTNDRVTSSNFNTTLATALSANKRRILFKRGHTFAHTGEVEIQQTGPGLIGAFGSGADPIVNTTTTQDVIQISDGPAVLDWRIMNLEIDGNTNAGHVITAGGPADQITMLGLYIHNSEGTGIQFAHGAINVNAGEHLFDQIAIVDVRVSVTEESGGYIAAGRVAFMGNRFEFSNSHGVRLPMTFRGVMNNNTIQDPGATHSVVKMIGPDQSEPDNLLEYGKWTEFVHSADNHFISNENGWMHELQPQSNHNNEQLRNIVMERNLLQGGPGSGTLYMVSALQVTFRNNIARMDDSSLGFYIGQFSNGPFEPPPKDIWVYNNTFYRANGNIRAVEVTNELGSPPNIVVRNNFGYAPNSSGSRTILLDTPNPPTITTHSHNSNSSQLLSGPWNFLTTPPTVPMHFRPTTGSHAISAGTPVPVWSDFFRVPQPGTRSMGAILPH